MNFWFNENFTGDPDGSQARKGRLIVCQ